eukprot:scaffold3075_cov33-Phaeocystis_antarctica.AAC.1
MPAMLVTLDVTKSSGLLNFCAFCRVAGRGHMKQGEGWTGRRECGRRVGRQQAVDEAAFARSVQKRARLQIGSRARGGAHGEHVLHGCDAGGVEAQRLVERLSALPRAERSAYDAAAGCGPARWWCKPHAGRGSAGGHQGTHPKHFLHACYAGRDEVQRLVELLRVLPSRREGHTKRGGVQAEREGPGWRLGEGRHLKHALHPREERAHVGDARDVPGYDKAVLDFGGGLCLVVVVLTDRRLQLGFARKDGRGLGKATAVGGWHGGVGQEHRQPLRRARDGV